MPADRHVRFSDFVDLIEFCAPQCVDVVAEVRENPSLAYCPDEDEVSLQAFFALLEKVETRRRPTPTLSVTVTSSLLGSPQNSSLFHRRKRAAATRV